MVSGPTAEVQFDPLAEFAINPSAINLATVSTIAAHNGLYAIGTSDGLFVGSSLSDPFGVSFSDACDASLSLRLAGSGRLFATSNAARKTPVVA